MDPKDILVLRNSAFELALQIHRSNNEYDVRLDKVVADAERIAEFLATGK